MQHRNKRQLIISRIAMAVMCFICLAPTISLAWGDGGHMMVAYLAFKRLNPRAKTQVNKLLAIPINPAPISKATKDFVNASHWADDVKKLPDFEFSGDLHFVDFPFTTDG